MAGNEAVKQMLPDKSYIRYVNAYNKFLEWQKSQNIDSFKEEVFLAYFVEADKIFKPPTLWSMYSMLKSTMNCNHNVNIASYTQLVDFLKKKNANYYRKKTNVFETEHLNKFLTKAPDDVYLEMKVVAVFGLFGANRPDEIINVKSDHVKDNGTQIMISIPDSKTNITKVFPITGYFADIVRKYTALRPQELMTDRYFIQVTGGKGGCQVIYKQTIAKMPEKIATFLGLPDPAFYTARSFPKTSITTLSDIGTGIERIKRRDASKSFSVAEGYDQEPLKRRTVETISPAIKNVPHSEYKEDHTVTQTSTTILADACKSSSVAEEPSDSNDGTVLKRHHRTKESSDSNDDTDDTVLKRHHRTKASRHETKKRLKIQEEMNWYDEECLTQIKLTTDMFKRSSNMDEDYKMKMLIAFSSHRIELFKKYFAAINAVAISPIHTQTTAASINAAAENGRVASSDFEFVKVEPKVEPLDNTNDISQR